MWTNTVFEGFGERLKQERKRLKLNQTEFAQMAGTQRITQSQYENEERPPSLRYLGKILEGGVKLDYLLYGSTAYIDEITPEEKRNAEKKVFEAIEEYVSSKCNGQLSAEGRHALFDVWRAMYFQALARGESFDFNF